MQRETPYDIIVLGLGPVGLLACNIWGKMGYRVLGIDKTQQAYDFPRAIALDDEIVRIVQSVGLLQALLQHLRPFRGMELLDSAGKVLISGFLDYPSGFVSNHFFFYQPELEHILRQGCERWETVFTQYDTEIHDLRQNEHGVQVISAGKTIAKGKYLVACDGARSFTRHWLGVGMKDLGFKKKVLKVDALDRSENNPCRHTVQKFCSHETPWVQMHGVGKHIRWELNYDKGLGKNEIEKLETTQRLLNERGIDTSQLSILHSVQYRFRSVLAKTWHRGNIFIAGDAAHATPPYIGQGMGAGFRDIINLGWKIDAVLRGKLPESLFTSYQTERYPHAKLDIQKAILVGRLFTTRLWYLLKFLSHIPILHKRLQKLKVSRGKIGKGFFGSGRAARKLFPQIRLKEKLYSDMLFENQWALVFIGKEPPQGLSTLCVQKQLKYIHFGESLQDYHHLKLWARRQHAQYFIVRPDLYVFSSGNDFQRLLQEYQSVKTKLSKSAQ
ncbi:MAG: FAD-dependent monooxygenase [Bacteroidota bacterium]